MNLLKIIKVSAFVNSIRKYKSFKNESVLKIFIMTHKDFKNYRNNSAYVIVADDKSQLKEKYNLTVLYADKGYLYKLRRSYGEMSKLYYIYQLYKNGSYSSKYVGLNHYRRYFNFTDNIPNLDYIFQNYDVILSSPLIYGGGMKEQYCICHICEKYEEMLKVIKDIKPDYYRMAMKTIKEKTIYTANIFIMKKQDFIKYCEFIYDVLFEFDRRNNFTSDEDTLNYSKKLYNTTFMRMYQSRLQGFLAERLSNIFYYQHFKKIKTFFTGSYK